MIKRNRTDTQSFSFGVHVTAAAAEVEAAQLREKLHGAHVTFAVLPRQLLVSSLGEDDIIGDVIGGIIVCHVFLDLVSDEYFNYYVQVFLLRSFIFVHVPQGLICKTPRKYSRISKQKRQAELKGCHRHAAATPSAQGDLARC
jgi:hypothetical protein